MLPELDGAPNDRFSRYLPAIIETVVFVVAGAALAEDAGQRTPFQLFAMALLVVAFFALGMVGRRRRDYAVAFAAADVAIIVAAAAAHAPAATMALLIIGASFRAGTRVMRGEWWIFLFVDIVVLGLVLVRTTGDAHSRNWVIELTGFFIVALVLVQTAVWYGNVARRAYAALAEAHDKLRRYADRAGELAALRERERIALDIHDEIGHELTVLTLQLESAGLALASHPAAADVSRAHAASLQVLANVRRAVRNINVDPLERGPLDVAIRRACHNFGEGSGVALCLETASLPTFPAETTTHVVNIVREALTNATRHGQARSVRVEANADDAAVMVAIEDDGCGFAPDLNAMGHGLRGMRARAAAMGASLDITSTLGTGSLIRMRVPLTPMGAQT